MAAAWILFIALDSASGMLRAWYLRKMKNPFRCAYNFFSYGKMATLFVIAVLNFLVIAGKKKRKKS